MSSSQQSGIRSKTDDAFVLFDGFIKVSVLLKVGAQIGTAHGIPRIDLGRSPEVRIGFIGFAEQQEGAAQIVLGDEVVVGYGECVCPESVIVRPVAQLPMGRNRDREENAGCRNRAWDDASLARIG